MIDSIPTATLAVDVSRRIRGAPSGTLHDGAVAAIDGMGAHRPLLHRDVLCGSGRARASGTCAKAGGTDDSVRPVEDRIDQRAQAAMRRGTAPRAKPRNLLRADPSVVSTAVRRVVGERPGRGGRRSACKTPIRISTSSSWSMARITAATARSATSSIFGARAAQPARHRRQRHRRRARLSRRASPRRFSITMSASSRACIARGASAASGRASARSSSTNGSCPRCTSRTRRVRGSFGFGATLALQHATRSRQAAAFEALRDCLADDYWLAERVRGLGLAVRALRRSRRDRCDRTRLRSRSGAAKRAGCARSAPSIRSASRSCSSRSPRRGSSRAACSGSASMRAAATSSIRTSTRSLT